MPDRGPVVLDTSIVIAYMDRGDPDHEQVAGWVDRTDVELVTTPLAIAEMDHLVRRFGGATAAGVLHRNLAAGAYSVEWWDGALDATLAIAERFASMPLGLTDASLVALADRLGTVRIATLDERHFRALRPARAESAFDLLPSNALI